jgi:hypothetical protein
MSAPSLLTGPYATLIPAFATGYSNMRYRPAAAHTGSEYADVLDAVDRLALSMADVCRSAVDSLAIVAALEAEGLNDRTARDRFALPDLFALAEELHRRVPRDFDPPDPRPTPANGTARAILRGLLFATPSLCATAFLVTEVSGMTRLALACVQVLAWGYGQGVAHLAYSRLNSADRPAAERILRVGTVHALLACVWLLSALALMVGTPLIALVPVATGLCFSLAAMPALVLGAEFQLAATLAPAALGAVVSLLGLSDGAALAGSQVSAVVTVAFMFRLTQTKTRGGKAADPDITRNELRDLVPHVLSGLGVGALITVVLAGPITTGQGLIALHAAIVLTLSMGAGEWHARWYQRRVNMLLSMLADPALFPPPATRLMLTALLRQLATTAAVAAAGYALFDRGDHDALALYIYPVALAPGLLAVLFLRAIDASAVVLPIVCTLAASIAALPSGDTSVLSALALEFSALMAVRAAAALSRPWAHL